MRGDERRLTWDEQRASERARYADITARKVEYRRELRETGLAPQIATVAGGVPRCARARRLARRDRERTRGAQTRTPSRAAPSVARVCNRSRPCRRRRGNLGAARSAVSRAARRARARHGDPGLCLTRRRRCQPRFMRDLRDVDVRVERNGDVSYRWRDGGEAFRDRGPEIAFRDTSDAASPRGSSSRAPSGATRSRFTAAQTSKSVPCASPSNAGYTSTIRNCKFASASSSSNSNVLDRKIESCCASAPVIAPSSATARMSAGADERSYFLSLFAGAGGTAEVGCVVVGTQSGGGGCCRLSLSLILVRACSRSR